MAWVFPGLWVLLLAVYGVVTWMLFDSSAIPVHTLLSDFVRVKNDAPNSGILHTGSD